uniref:Uncharacterized protein n=1 Tax=Oryza punctata TaxID=4537 RepID=A0A0E0KIV3_ORYPU
MAEAKYNLFSESEIVLEMLDLCKRFAEAMSFDAEKVQPSLARSYHDSIIFAQFLRNQNCY